MKPIWIARETSFRPRRESALVRRACSRAMKKLYNISKITTDSAFEPNIAFTSILIKIVSRLNLIDKFRTNTMKCMPAIIISDV